ncbi:hypothetical protein J5N97_007272 [Dioscorea zingiberensis]|uniref:Glycosyltransferase n=1 Tax=Dioscorea zingiberensis TaxID=325984 RepID=A0A9D5DBP4_9LILI|nr:hypothetical protein J5N97_007272 [Dioscorea zingiberensis]
MPLQTDAELHLVMYPWLAFGHISPFVQLARKLAALPGIRTTFITTSGNVPRVTELLSGSPNVSIHPLRLPHVEGLPPGIENTAEATPATAELLKVAVDLTQPDVATLLARLRPHAILYDCCQQWMPSIARPLGVKALAFSVFSLVSGAYITVPSRRSCSSELHLPPPGFPTTSSITSIPKYQAKDISYVFKSFNGMPCVYDRHVSGHEASDGIIFKSCMEMEGPYINYVESQFKKPVLLAGPVVPEPPKGKLETHWEEWLESFPENSNSVIFCSFGSETFLSDEGIKELLLGLEMVGMPFIAVINLRKGDESPEEVLKKKVPEGFEERVKGRGIVRTGWVQQQHILQHKKVGCYFCHAGLSSVVEGIVNECRLVMLPQFGDQFFNAALFAGDLGVGVEVERDGEDGSFTREGVRDAVMKVMGDEKVKEKQKELREFLLDKEVQGKFMVTFVEKLREMVV